MAGSTLRIKAPELRGNNLALGWITDRECYLDGPAGTGKTVGALYKVHRVLSQYPGARALVSRKTNTALSGSAMVTYKDNILRGRADIKWYGGSKVKPAAWIYPNGSEMIVNGLDKPEKVLSAEFDIAYINEAPECEENDVEFVRMRLRPRTGGPALPFRQLIMDGNPGPPTHWLNERMNRGQTRRLISRHEDNPRYFDLRTNDWTDEGREYVFGILGGLTGVRLARYRYGIWAAAEGTVYEDVWDRARIIVNRFAIPKEWPRFLAIDFGFTNPFVCLWCAKDPDGRLIIYRQLYKTKTLVEDHAKSIAIASGWFHLLPSDHPRYKDRPAEWSDPLPRVVICDHDAEDRATLERHLRLYTTPAKKSVSDGIQAVASRFKAAGDGRARVEILQGSLVEQDQELISAKRPTCLEEEPESYVWDTRQGMKKGDQPVKENDHALDALRYLVAFHDLMNNSVTYYPNIWR